MTPSDHPTELLAGFVLGQLLPHEQESVEVHLLGCPQCRAEVGTLRDALFGLAADLPAAPVPPGVWEKVQARRQPALPEQEALPPTPLPRRRPALLWPLVAALGLGLVVGGAGTRTHMQAQQQAQIGNLVSAGAQPLKLLDRQGHAFGTVLLLKDMRAMIFLDRRPPAGQVYQVWGRPQGSGARPVSLGITEGTTLSVSRCNSYEFVGVSLEPVGGNAAPTKPLGRVKVPLSKI